MNKKAIYFWNIEFLDVLGVYFLVQLVIFHVCVPNISGVFCLALAKPNKKPRRYFWRKAQDLRFPKFLKCPKCPVKALSVLLNWKVVCTERTCLQNYSVYCIWCFFPFLALSSVTHRQLIFHVLNGTWSLGFCLKMCTMGKFQPPVC